MEVLKMHCPSCGASVDVQDGIDAFYCSHCGTKLLVSGQDKDTINAKVTLRIAEKKLDLEYADKEKERQFQLEQQRRNYRNLILYFIFVSIFFAIIFYLLKSGFFSYRNIFKMWFG